MRIKRWVGIVLSFLVVVETTPLFGQVVPTVGLSLEKHTGAILSMNISSVDSLIATVSEDRTLKIWEYPSCHLLRSINMPEVRGNRSRLGECFILNNNIVLVADDSGNDYEYRQLTNKDKDAVQIQYGKSGASNVQKYGNVKTTYCFYAVDWKQGAIVDRVGAMSSPISEFILSPDESMLLVTSSGKEAMLYETKSLRLLGEFVYNDEEILGGVFLSRDEFVIVTDLYYYRYKVRHFADVHYVERTQIQKKRLRPLFGSKKVVSVSFSEDRKWAYFFSRNEFLYAINIETLSINKDEKPLGYEEYTYRVMVSDSTKVYYNGEEKTIATNKRDKRIFERLSKKDMHGYRINSSNNILFTDTTFMYRTDAAPFVKLSDGVLLIQYEGNKRVWRFTENEGLIPASESETEQIRLARNTRRYQKYGVLNSFYERIKMFYEYIENSTGLYYIDDDSEGPIVAKYAGWRQVLPASAKKIYNWVTPHHFILSLNDGTLRWYNSYTGEEELSLFISKDNEWIIWSPDGRYSQSSPIAGNMIEWRYQTFSRIEVLKPMDNRRVYCRPHAINHIIQQLYSLESPIIESRRTSSLDNIVSIDNVLTDSYGHYYIDYSLDGYNPMRYGRYDITLFLDDVICDSIVHNSRGNKGEIIASAKVGAEIVEIVLNTEYKGSLSPAVYEISDFISLDSLWVTSIGVNNYNHYAFSNLKAPVNDANDIADLFLKDLSIGNAEWKDILKLTNDEATSENIIGRINDVVDKSGVFSLSIMYFSGHGVVKDNDFHIVLSSGETINLSNLVEQCSKTKGKYLFIVDACYSGQLLKQDNPNVAIITSTDATNKSLDGKDDLSESLFTSLLKDKLKNMNKATSLDDLFLDISVEAKQGSLRPQCYNNIGNIKITR